jgi:hypothetical protein
MVTVKNLVLQHGASSKEKAILAIYTLSSARGIMAFSRERLKGIDLFRSIPMQASGGPTTSVGRNQTRPRRLPGSRQIDPLS